MEQDVSGGSFLFCSQNVVVLYLGDLNPVRNICTFAQRKAKGNIMKFFDYKLTGSGFEVGPGKGSPPMPMNASVSVIFVARKHVKTMQTNKPFFILIG